MKFTASVIHGTKVATPFGIATANLDVSAVQLDLAEGVYLVDVKWREKSLHGLLHFGHRQTFGGEFSAEIHLLDFDQQIYDENLEVETLKQLRPVKNFRNADLLFTQIESDIITAKKFFLRRKLKPAWRNISDKIRGKFAVEAVEKISELPEFIDAEIILAFAPMADEINFIKDLTKKNLKKIWAFPVSHGDGTMDFFVSDYADLRPGKFGILEPKSNQPVDLKDKKIVMFVPALAVDKSGYRLGRGAGYYDRWLANFPAEKSILENPRVRDLVQNSTPRLVSVENLTTIAVVPEFAHLDEVPVEPHDQSIDQVIVINA